MNNFNNNINNTELNTFRKPENVIVENVENNVPKIKKNNEPKQVSENQYLSKEVMKNPLFYQNITKYLVEPGKEENIVEEKNVNEKIKNMMNDIKEE